nr:putative e3 ubiquitin-protein ligase xbos36 [Quercus suber]
MIDPSIRLRRAIHLNDSILVTRLLRSHPNLVRNPDFADRSNTSLHLAASSGHTEIAALLIGAGHERSELSGPGCRGGEAQEDGRAMQEETSRNADHETPLMLAARNGHVEVGKLLVTEYPRSVPYTNQAGLDALAIAAQSRNSTALIPILLASELGPSAASPHARDHEGNTALHHASAAGSLKALKVLLEAGADPVAKNNYDWTPLAYSQSVAAEVYFKNLVVEFERRQTDGVEVSGESERSVKGGAGSTVRMVDDHEQESVGLRIRGDSYGSKSNTTDESDSMGDAIQRYWSPVERRRPTTPGSFASGKDYRESRLYDWGAGLQNVRTRSDSGEGG